MMAAIAMTAIEVFGAEPKPDSWRAHRYESFKCVPVDSNAIVFMGNSITNFNEWRECFGNDPRIINRGASSAHSQEMIDNIESVIAGRPAKVFLGIGTNDLYYGYTPEEIAANIERFIERFQKESPRTKVHVTTILPTDNGAAKGRNVENITTTNGLLEKVCARKGVPFINIFDPLQSILTDRSISTDNLHLTAKGYKIWCDIIAPYVGVECTLPIEFEQNSSGLNHSYGMRSTIWSALPIEPDDIVMIGDELICCGAWNELLGTEKARNRGIWWGYNGYTTKQWAKNLEAIFRTNGKLKQRPSTVVLNIGMKETNDTTIPIDSIVSGYANVVGQLRAYLPSDSTRLIIVGLTPRGDATFNNCRLTPFNEALHEIAAKDINGAYVDAFTPLLTNDQKADSSMVANDMLTAKGYNKLSQLLAATMVGDDIRTIDDEQFAGYYEYVSSRSALGELVDKAMRLRDGNDRAYTATLEKELMNALSVLGSSKARNIDFDSASEKLQSLIP